MAADACCCCLDFELEEVSQLEMELADPALVWGSDEYVQVVATDAEAYDGPYEATPTWNQQTFGTANRLMRSDFAVDSIVKLEVPNDAGGLTLTI